jgi:hypothetical protein
MKNKTHVRLDADVAKEITKLAKKNRRSVSGEASHLLRQQLNKTKSCTSST